MTAPKQTVLVIDYAYNWAPLFKEHRNAVVVEQTEWARLDASIAANGDLVCRLEAHPEPLPWTNQGRERVVTNPACVLVRNFPMGLRGESYRNQVLAFLIRGCPMVCSADAVLASLDRAQLYAGLRSVSARLGPDSFSLVPLAYFPNTKLGMPAPNELLAPAAAPSAAASSASASASAAQPGRIVVKVGSCNSGFGKFMATDARQREDLWSVLATQKDYVTEEAFVAHAFEYRLQVIGAHLRCFKRNSSSSWKNNSGMLTFESMPVEPKHAEWAAALRALYGGGNDVFGLDVLRRADGTDVVLEINPTANGLMYEFEAEDCARIRDLVLQRMGIDAAAATANAP